MDELTRMRPLKAPSFLSVLIIARPGKFRDGLSALVSSIPYVDRIHHEPNGAAALKRILQYRPALVLWDGDLRSEDLLTVLPVLKDQNPDTVNLVLVEDIGQEKYLRRAGADAVIIKGIYADKLLMTIETLLSSDIVE